MHLRGKSRFLQGVCPLPIWELLGLPPRLWCFPAVEGSANLYRASGELILVVTTTYIGQRAYLYRFIQRSI